MVYKHTVHDGSVSYPVVLAAPEPGKGKHAKTVLQAARRHKRNRAMNELLKVGAKPALARKLSMQFWE